MPTNGRIDWRNQRGNHEHRYARNNGRESFLHRIDVTKTIAHKASRTAVQHDGGDRSNQERDDERDEREHVGLRVVVAAATADSVT